LPGYGLDRGAGYGASMKRRCRSRPVCRTWVERRRSEERLRTVQRLERDARFYFLHSYYFDCASNDNVLATSKYGHRIRMRRPVE